MANKKKVNNVQNTITKKNNNVSKKNVNGSKKNVKNSPTNNKKTGQAKKKLEIVDEINRSKKPIKDTSKKPLKPNDNVNKPNGLTQEEIIAQRKERNRKKYEKGQKKYRDNKEKKKVIIEDKVEEPKEEIEIKLEVKEEYQKAVVGEDNEVKEEIVLKKTTEIEADTSSEKIKKIERKEKRKTNRKTTGFTQTLTNIKELSVNTINDVRERTNDDTIPLGHTFIEKSKRSKRLIIEAIVYAVILTVIDVLCIIIFDGFNFLRLFDVKSLNVVITIFITLVFNFFVAFMVDYFVTNVWLTKKRKKEDGEQNGNNRSFREERKKNIRIKEGK